MHLWAFLWVSKPTHPSLDRVSLLMTEKVSSAFHKC